MTRPYPDPGFEPRVADWLETDPDSAPAAVLGTVLAALPSIPQRRALRVPWRFPTMNSFAKVAIAAVALIAVGAVGVIALRPGGTVNVGSAPSPTATSTPSPTAAPSPSAAVAPSPAPPLTGSFTSTLNGIALSYPAGWSTRAATEPWTTDWPIFEDPNVDVLYDPELTDHLFVGVASQPLAGRAGDQWAVDTLEAKDCGPGDPITIDGASGLLGECLRATVTSGGRGYFVWLYLSGDDPWLGDVYDRAWFEQVLATVDLRPEDALDVSPPPS